MRIFKSVTTGEIKTEAECEKLIKDLKELDIPVAYDSVDEMIEYGFIIEVAA